MKLSNLNTESTFSLSDFLVKVKAAGAGDVKVTLSDFLVATGIWSELGRTALGVAGDTITVNFTAKKYLRILMSTIPSGVNDIVLRLNNDSGSNYSCRYSADFAAGVALTSQTSVPVDPGAAAVFSIAQIDIVNILAQEKVGQIHCQSGNTAGAGTAPSLLDLVFKWANTAAQANRVDIINNGAGDFAIGSEVVVLGHD